MQTDYRTYIKSAAWRKRAQAAKQRAGYRCQVCNKASSSRVRLDAHHRTYERLGHEKDADITVLCRDCHRLYHGSQKSGLGRLVLWLLGG